MSKIHLTSGRTLELVDTYHKIKKSMLNGGVIVATELVPTTTKSEVHDEREVVININNILYITS